MRKVIFLGTPDFAVPSLQKLIETDGIQVLAIVTQADKPFGRGYKLRSPAIKLAAESLHLKCYQTTSIKKDVDLIAKLKKMKPDFLITVAFGQILSEEILKIPRYGTINVHASLLPEYRGANPIQRAIMEGREITGITTMLTNIGLDTGDILVMQEIFIDPDDTLATLTEKLSQVGSEVLVNTLRGFNFITPKKQEDSSATIAKKVVDKERFIDWNQPALQTHNLVRGLNPSPVALAQYNNQHIMIEKTSLTDFPTGEKVGLILGKIKQGIMVNTGNGVLLVEKVKPSGKKSMDALAWANGTRIRFNLDSFDTQCYVS